MNNTRAKAYRIDSELVWWALRQPQPWWVRWWRALRGW